jgi:hypothetical protein
MMCSFTLSRIGILMVPVMPPNRGIPVRAIRRRFFAPLDLLQFCILVKFAALLGPENTLGTS